MTCLAIKEIVNDEWFINNVLSELPFLDHYTHDCEIENIRQHLINTIKFCQGIDIVDKKEKRCTNANPNYNLDNSKYGIWCIRHKKCYDVRIQKDGIICLYENDNKILIELLIKAGVILI